MKEQMQTKLARCWQGGILTDLSRTCYEQLLVEIAVLFQKFSFPQITHQPHFL